MLLALVVAGCATTQGIGTTQQAFAYAPDFAAARTLAANDAQLAGAARNANAAEIDRLLGDLDNATLSQNAAALPPGDPMYNFAGRALLRRGLPLPRPFDTAALWQTNTAARPPAEADGYRPPQKLAVLLPLSGNLAVAAAPVRDGLLAGYYNETRRRPDIDFYDTSGTATGAIDAYQRAITAGADYVVGPLGQDQVSALFQQSSLPVPVLVLNRGNGAPPPGNAGFSLAPEDDGAGAADYLADRERRNVLVLHGTDDNGRRAAQAFSEGFQQRGGVVAATISVNDEPGDLSAALATVAQKNIDGVFLAVKGSTARALAPQLALAGLAGKSRVGTSQLSSGTGKPEEDVVLDGIIFPTETWTARGVVGLPPASVTAERLPTARGPAARLFAFGYDAWLLSAYMDKLVTGQNVQLPGATGQLQLDGFGNVLRSPTWATFSGGHAVPVAGGG